MVLLSPIDLDWTLPLRGTVEETAVRTRTFVCLEASDVWCVALGEEPLCLSSEVLCSKGCANSLETPPC